MFHNHTVAIETESVFLLVDVCVDVTPGEPAYRYYDDGSGYPGSPDEINRVDDVTVLECDFGDDYCQRSDLGRCTDTLDLLARMEVESGLYDDEILEAFTG
ncbi:hypothetical protein [Planctomycetes bacterium TBK1r]|uniref:Uncharacterized protein n=1 Tax=Stieleria magnilauensis TaxID=2527963 RepID=A0ABX5XI54_9BACT|nr:hypothetical protein TBK1r_05780 [Planctomycetes bacterium TBK1r]